MAIETEFWYRYVAKRSEKHPYAVKFTILKFRVTRHTPKGVWLYIAFNKEKFVLNDARKRFAYPTPELAWESMQHRAERRVALLKYQLQDAELIAKITKQQTKPPEYHPTMVIHYAENSRSNII